ncbi:MAG: hypothetical protein Ct9H300mP13_8100 [Gammaproteobacteria bacterium]|nr:MAG: hypothetical protein Ct9H300mP13_8100 [Gammaproteobacteria bacterium]
MALIGHPWLPLASASVIAPFEYVAMPCAVVWGLMLYSESRIELQSSVLFS